MSAKSPGTVIVTGGSRGIGAATARLAGARGWNVLVNYRADRKSAERVAADIEKAGGRAQIHGGDVAEERAVLDMFDQAEKAFGPVTGLANNAGITGPSTRVEALVTADLRRVVEVNVIGAVMCAREAVRRMSTAKGGKGGAIVNVGSRASELGAPNSWVHYALTKGAIDTLTVGLASEVAREGIRVNAVAPGLIDTEIHAAGGGADRLQKLTPSVPMARIGTAEEVAEAIVWLLSPAASYITGAILPISGGR